MLTHALHHAIRGTDRAIIDAVTRADPHEYRARADGKSWVFPEKTWLAELCL